MDAIDKEIHDTSVPGLIDATYGELLAIDEHALSEEFSTQAARYAYLAAQAAKAEALYQEARTVREQVYADVELDYRDSYKDQKTTEAYIRSLVIADDDYIKAMGLENAALRDHKILRAITDAMRQRGDMLISLGATLRHERDMTQMSIRQVKAKLVNNRD